MLQCATVQHSNLPGPNLGQLNRAQIGVQNSLCKKKIPRHIKMPAYVWSTKYR
jgi:hypothetical protein